MKIFSGFTVESARILKKGGVGVIPTDTIYGIVGSALSHRAVNRIYRLRHRRPDKPMIILIDSLDDLKIFGIKIGDKTRKLFKEFWPGNVSILLPCASKKFFYLHRGTKQLAFRLPAKRSLRRLLAITGPLVAPSANFEGKPPAKTIREARNYFGEKVDPVRGRPRQQASATGTSGRPASNGVDFYVDGGKLISKPSTLVTLNSGKISILRQGATRIRDEKYGSTSSP